MTEAGAVADAERAFGLAPFHGRRDPRKGIGGGHHGFGIHIYERLGQDPAARLANPSQGCPPSVSQRDQGRSTVDRVDVASDYAGRLEVLDPGRESGHADLLVLGDPRYPLHPGSLQMLEQRDRRGGQV